MEKNKHESFFAIGACKKKMEKDAIFFCRVGEGWPYRLFTIPGDSSRDLFIPKIERGTDNHHKKVTKNCQVHVSFPLPI